ncbi:Kinase [Hexamita inflata]|uniref:CAMK CAMKL n=1 Tax=Hexamita inflata TaxID=28002 RepID=A0AA86TA18_9EUKA|nr:CAMK CAMKL [Hexamita inflata]
MLQQQNSQVQMRGNTLYVQNYQILNKLDEGCEAAVFSALSSSNQIVALYHISNRSRALNRIQLHKISNSITGVVKMLDYFEIQQSSLQYAKQYQILSNPGTIIIFEYLEGDSIDKCLLKHSPEEILDAINQLTTIIHQLHSHNIFHLDIKPDNIFYFDGQVTVLDFGSAQMLQKQTQKTEPILDFLFSSDECLTKVYESTKYFRSERDIQKQLVKPIVAQKYDVYSIGCILYYLLTGLMIHTCIQRMSYHAYQIRTKYGADITDLICGMLDDNQYSRYTTEQILQHPAICGKQKKLRTFSLEYILELRKRLVLNEKKYGVPQRSKSVAQSRYDFRCKEQNQLLIDDQHAVFYELQNKQLYTENTDYLNPSCLIRVKFINRDNHTILEQGRHQTFNRFLRKMHFKFLQTLLYKQIVHKLIQEDKQELSCVVTTDTSEIQDDSESGSSQYQVNDNIESDISLTVYKSSRRNTLFNNDKIKSPLTLQITQINTEFSTGDIFGDKFQQVEMSVSNNSNHCIFEEYQKQE